MGTSALSTYRHILKDINPIISQEEVVCFLNSARDSSWDITSALLTLCDHNFMNIKNASKYPGLLLDQFSMHHPSIYNQCGPLNWFPDINEVWEVVNNHFKDIHGLDLTDPRINWSFDT